MSKTELVEVVFGGFIVFLIFLILKQGGVNVSLTVYAGDPCVEQRATCDRSPSQCTGSCPGPAPGPNCQCKKAVNCKCVDTCTTEVCGNTICTSYDTTCDYWWDCDEPPPTFPPATKTPPPTIPPLTKTPPPTMPPLSPSPSLVSGLCQCDYMYVEGRFIKGETVTFYSYSKVNDPDNNKVEIEKVIFHVEKNGQEVLVSSPIDVIGPERTVDDKDRPIDSYFAQWNYPIPAEEKGRIKYRVWVEIRGKAIDSGTELSCTNPLSSIRILGSLAEYKTKRDKRIDRLLTKRKEQGSLYRLLNFLTGLFAGEKRFSSLSLIRSVSPTPIFYPFQKGSQKQGTFLQATPSPAVEKGCAQLSFWVED